MDSIESPTSPAAPAPRPYAGFWIRFLGVLLDGFIVGAPIIWIVLRAQFHPLSKLDYAVLYLLPAVYQIGFWRWKGATPGKMALGLRIVKAENGEQMLLGRCVGRYFAMILSWIPLCLGYMWVGWDARKQGFHDKLAGTIVVRDREPIMPVAVWIGLVVGAYVLIFIGSIALAVFWGVSHRAELREKGAALKVEAQAFAQSHNEEQCRDEGLRRLDSCDGIVCAALAKVFTGECLRTAHPSPAFCAGVPPQSSIFESARWASTECAQLGRPTPACTRFMAVVPEVCSEPAAEAAPAPIAPIAPIAAPGGASASNGR